MNRCSFTTAWWLPLVFGLLAACQGPRPEYRIETGAAGPLVAGSEGRVSLRFVPREGYHWNEEFPARLRVQEAQGVQPLRESFSAADQDFHSEGGVGVLDVPVAASKTGDGKVKALADFSICNAQECRVFKQVPVEVPVQVR
ncbi:MAG TPA: hypothetical protein PLQ97_01025 [Myxococcota bacterium]|nr:hypothetical protein [Myxococcota bacterium]HQK49757.1 hypothetical protein [Myxococcota bacterium]